MDFLGISCASFCLVHCLVFPMLSIIPIGFSDNHWIDVFFACIGLFVVSKIVLSSTSSKVKFILTASISLIVIGVVLEIVLNIDSKLLIIGGVGMIFGHLLNYKKMKNKNQIKFNTH